MPTTQNGSTGAAFQRQSDVEGWKGSELVPVARHKSASAVVNVYDRPEPVPLDLEEPVGVGERLGAAK